MKLIEQPDGLLLDATLPGGWAGDSPRKLVTTEMLGVARIPGAAFERPDGEPIRVDVDYLGKPRNPSNPTPGPLENLGQGPLPVAGSGSQNRR